MENSNIRFLKNLNEKLDTRLPLILLIIAGLCIFSTESRDGGFNPGGLYSGVSVHGMTLSQNLLNKQHPLFMFMSKEIKEGKEVYTAYNRFPVFPFLLIGLITSPFNNNFDLQIYIARQLMNIFFFFSLIVVFKLVKDLTKNSYLALSVVSLTFSSYYLLYYNNMIFNDIPALLGFVLAIYVVFKAEKTRLKLSHILFYSLFPVCLGWQPLSVYVLWLLLDSFEFLFKKGVPFRKKIINIIKRPSFMITAMSISGGIIILGLQLLNEWSIVGGSFLSLPSVNSALWRSGFISSAGHTQYQWAFNWPSFLFGVARSMTTMLLPFWPIFQIEPGLNASAFIVISLIVYTVIKYLKEKNSINKLHLIMVLSGLFWAVPMRHFVALHEFQSIFYIGFAVSIFTRFISKLNLKIFKLLAIDLLLFFLVNLALSNHLKVEDTAMNKLASQFQEIRRQLPENSKIYFDGDPYKVIRNNRYAIDFLFSGHWYTQLGDADYVVSGDSVFNKKKLTNNPEYNLFEVSGENR